LKKSKLRLGYRDAGNKRMETGKIANRLQGWLEQLFPNWMHGRRLRRRERQWLNPEFSPLWTTDEPQKELVEAIDSGWFPKNHLILLVRPTSAERFIYKNRVSTGAVRRSTLKSKNEALHSGNIYVHKY